MKSQDFLIHKIKKLVRSFKTLKVSYSFHALSDTHSIEILPKEFYHNNTNFKAFEENLIVKFITKFPMDSLCILTEDSIVPIENIELSFIGDTYKDLNSSYCTILEYEGELFENSYYQAFDDIFRDFKPEINGSFILEQEIKGIYSLPSFFPQNQVFSVENKEADRKNELSNNFTSDMDYSLAA